MTIFDFFNKHLWLLVKIAATGFTTVGTWDVFHRELVKDHNSFVAVTATLLAVGLIDFMYIALINFLEEPIREGENLTTRWAYAVGLILLYFSVIAIGLMDSGVLAVAPRIGLGILASVTILRFYGEWRMYQDTHWELNFEKKKVRQEREDQRKLLEDMRKTKNKERKYALQDITKELREEYRFQHRTQLLTHTLHADSDNHNDHKVIPVSSMLDKPVQKRLPMATVIDPTEDPDLPDYISYDRNRPYGEQYFWKCQCGFEGRTKSERGAKIAYSRHQTEVHNNE